MTWADFRAPRGRTGERVTCAAFLAPTPPAVELHDLYLDVVPGANLLVLQP